MTASSPAAGLVIGMGLGTVFVGLICIIVICYIMGAVIKLFESKKKPVPEAPKAAPAEVSEELSSADKAELIAVMSAVIAEELGESVEAIRIKSVRKVS